MIFVSNLEFYFHQISVTWNNGGHDSLKIQNLCIMNTNFSTTFVIFQYFYQVHTRNKSNISYIFPFSFHLCVFLNKIFPLRMIEIKLTRCHFIEIYNGLFWLVFNIQNITFWNERYFVVTLCLLFLLNKCKCLFQVQTHKNRMKIFKNVVRNKKIDSLDGRFWYRNSRNIWNALLFCHHSSARGYEKTNTISGRKF